MKVVMSLNTNQSYSYQGYYKSIIVRFSLESPEYKYSHGLPIFTFYTRFIFVDSTMSCIKYGIIKYKNAAYHFRKYMNKDLSTDKNGVMVGILSSPKRGVVRIK